MPARSIIALMAAATALLAPRLAAACATCSCGDPTLTTMGDEKPFAGRLRGSVDLRMRSDVIGEADVDQVDLREQRVDLALTWAPTDRAFLSLVVPLAYRDITHVNLARERVLGLGDLELRAKYFLYEDRHFAPRHLVALQLGTQLPTSSVQRDAAGMLLPGEAQLGTGGFDPIVGVSYGYFEAPWSAYASVTAVIPTMSRAGIEPGASLLGTVAGQYQLGTNLAARLGVDTRLDRRTREGGVVDPDSGGFIAFASPEIVYSPRTDLLLSASVRLPVVNRLSGRHDEGPVAQTAVVYDF